MSDLQLRHFLTLDECLCDEALASPLTSDKVKAKAYFDPLVPICKFLVFLAQTSQVGCNGKITRSYRVLAI